MIAVAGQAVLAKPRHVLPMSRLGRFRDPPDIDVDERSQAAPAFPNPLPAGGIWVLNLRT